MPAFGSDDTMKSPPTITFDVGDPHPGVVVGLAEPVTQLDRPAAETVEQQPVLVVDRRRAVARLADDVAAVRAPARELRVEGVGEVTGGLGVALEALGHVHVADDVGRVVPARLGVVEQRRRAEGVVVVAVRVDHVPDGQVGDRPQLAHHPRPAGEEPGVDDRHAVGAEDVRRVAEAGEEVHAGRDLARLPRPQRDTSSASAPIRARVLHPSAASVPAPAVVPTGS